MIRKLKILDHLFSKHFSERSIWTDIRNLFRRRFFFLYG